MKTINMKIINMKIRYLVVAVITLFLSACASNAPAVGPAEQSQSAGGVDKTAEAEQLYCERMTGSRLERKKVCYTEEQRKQMRENAKSAVDVMQQGVIGKKN